MIKQFVKNISNRAVYKIYIIVIILIFIAGGIFVWQYFGVPKEGIPNSGTITWEKHTEGIYCNEKYSFQLIMPSSWKNYVKKEEEDGQTTIISFGLPLETDEISQWLSEPEKTEKIFKIWSLYIMPISEWELRKRECENPAVDYPCFYPMEITRNEDYVFGSGQYSITGGWDPCAGETKNKETYFCSVYWDMSPTRGYDIEQSFSLFSKWKELIHPYYNFEIKIPSGWGADFSTSWFPLEYSPAGELRYISFCPSEMTGNEYCDDCCNFISLGPGAPPEDPSPIALFICDDGNSCETDEIFENEYYKQVTRPRIEDIVKRNSLSLDEIGGRNVRAELLLFDKDYESIFNQIFSTFKVVNK